MENFEEQLRKDLHQFLLSMKEVDDVYQHGRGEDVGFRPDKLTRL